MEWFKTYSRGILSGSLSREDDTTQLIWIKLLALVNETRQRDGWLHYAEGKPMERSRIAITCGVSEEALNKALNVYLSDVNNDGTPRIQIKEDGDIFLTNWDMYQRNPNKGDKSLPETAEEKKLREIRQQSQLNRKYPDTAPIKETTVIVSPEGDVLKKETIEVKRVS